jgi:hypothetical protein
VKPLNFCEVSEKVRSVSFFSNLTRMLASDQFSLSDSSSSSLLEEDQPIMSLDSLTGGFSVNSVVETFGRNPNPPLREILCNIDLESAVQHDNTQIMDYFTREDTVRELVRWAFTLDFKDEENYTRLARSATQILSRSKALISRLQDSEIFQSALLECQSRGFENSAKLSENFQTLFLEYVRCTNGGFVQHFPGILSFLVEHIDLSPLRFLLVQLLTVYKGAFSEEELEEVAMQMSEAIRGPSGYFVAAAIRDALKDTEGGSLVPRFQSDTVLKGLLEAALNPGHVANPNLFQAEVFTVIEIIARNCAIAGPIIQMFESRYEFDAAHFHCGTVAALRVFKGGLQALLPRFFEENSQTILNGIIARRLQELPTVTLAAYLKDFGIVDHIYKAFEANQVNGHLTDLASFLDGHNTISPILQTREWKAFAEKQLHPRLSDRAVETIEDSVESNIAAARRSLPQLGAFVGARQRAAPLSFLLSQVSHSAEPSSKRSITGSGSSGATPLPALGPTSLSMTPVLAGQQPGAATGSGKPGFIGTGASFSLPTLYQADKLVRPLIC